MVRHVARDHPLTLRDVALEDAERDLASRHLALSIHVADGVERDLGPQVRITRPPDSSLLLFTRLHCSAPHARTSRAAALASLSLLRSRPLCRCCAYRHSTA